MDTIKINIVLIILSLFNINSFSQHSKPDSLLATFCDEEIKLDGKLDEPCWTHAKNIENFFQRELNEGMPSTEKTRVAALFNTNEIIFGIWCYDSEPDKISAQQMARDFDWESDDNIEILISTFNDNRNGYLFVTNPNGAMADVWIGDEGKNVNKDWNGVWDVAVQRDQQGWFAEMVIPFSTLKFKKDSIQVWGINFERNIRRKKEQLLWQGWSRLYRLEKISQGGRLTGIKNIKQKSKIEIKPYALGGLEFTEGKKSNTGKIGGRIDYAFSPKLQTSLFAQWNNEENEILLNYRINWIPKIGSFFYFVINQNINAENESFKVARTTILGKLIWRFAI